MHTGWFFLSVTYLSQPRSFFVYQLFSIDANLKIQTYLTQVFFYQTRLQTFHFLRLFLYPSIFTTTKEVVFSAVYLSVCVTLSRIAQNLRTQIP